MAEIPKTLGAWPPDLDAAWTSFDIRHELTVQGIEKFVKDYESTLALVA